MQNYASPEIKRRPQPELQAMLMAQPDRQLRTGSGRGWNLVIALTVRLLNTFVATGRTFVAHIPLAALAARKG